MTQHLEGGYEGDIDANLIPPGTPYGATLSKARKGNPFKYAGFATLGTPLQHMTDHS